MTLDEAVELIRAGVPRRGGAWVDLGAGTGLFSRALASLLGPTGRVVAVDQDAGALATLRERLRSAPADWASVRTLVGDYRDTGAVASMAGGRPDGILIANALHYDPDPGSALPYLADMVAPDGRVVVVEYDGRPANPWVPFPVPMARLRELAAVAELREPQIVGERPSTYGGTMYCAVLERR